jgi:hypothetical protein
MLSGSHNFQVQGEPIVFYDVSFLVSMKDEGNLVAINLHL